MCILPRNRFSTPMPGNHFGELNVGLRLEVRTRGGLQMAAELEQTSMRFTAKTASCRFLNRVRRFESCRGRKMT